MHCIRTIAVNSYFQMQMAACNASGVANVTDDFPGLYLLTGGDADGRTVGVQCFQPAAVVDLDAMAVAAAPAVKTVNATLIPAATAVTRLCSLARK